ncbi:hypothetical protein C1645_822270 [Glomus cerebriforme]|uniref:Uncharacterized protein n=1 Tax=Glomus cerebriforme TaxID=658196 RepID=A0A397T317_9GLOM|nr:hypothetical protein C1645_822270 [Glomus cerebriforme]
MLLYVTNFIFLGFAIHRNYVDPINGLFVIVPIEFMCLVIFAMISGPSLLWIKTYLAITLVELSLYLERAKNVKENEKGLEGIRNKLNELEEIINNMNMDNEKQGKKRVVLEINIREKINEEGNEEKDNFS